MFGIERNSGIEEKRRFDIPADDGCAIWRRSGSVYICISIRLGELLTLWVDIMATR